MSTIKQKSISVTLSDMLDTGLVQYNAVEVRRMRWKPARDFLKALAAHLGSLGTDTKAMLADLPKLIASAEDLATLLIAGSTDLMPKDIDNLDLLDATEIIGVALTLNLGDELKNSCAGIAAALRGVVPAFPATTSKTTNNGASPTPSSSTPDTPPTTSTAAPSSTST